MNAACTRRQLFRLLLSSLAGIGWLAAPGRRRPSAKPYLRSPALRPDDAWITTFCYDASGRLSTSSPAGASQLRATSYTYDSQTGRLPSRDVWLVAGETGGQPVAQTTA